MDMIQQRARINMADELICEEIEKLRRLSRDSTWQDCAETTEIEVLRALAALIEVRYALVQWQHTYGAS